MAKQPKGELVVIGFNYDLLETKLADKVRTAAVRIGKRNGAIVRLPKARSRGSRG